MKYKIQLKNITKKFKANSALKAIDLNINEGKIYSFLGENGAGKSTLMNIISGYYPPSSGHIYINNIKIEKYNPIELNSKGVGMVHQQLSLIDKLSIYDNIIIGSKHGYYKGNKQCYNKIMGLFRLLELDLDMESLVRECTIAEKQIIEIVKLLYKDCEILILDEPFSQLSNIETIKLIQIIKELSQNLKKTILFISHDIDEVLDISDYVAVLRKGSLIMFAENNSLLSSEELIGKMIGESDFKQQNNYVKRGSTSILIELQGVKVFNSNRAKASLDIEHLTLKKGEILGLAGVLNNGQSEFVDLLLGKSGYQGTIKIRELEVKKKDIQSQIKASIIPLNVRRNAAFPDLSIHENLSFNDTIGSKRKIISSAKSRTNSHKIINTYDIRPNQIDLEVENLSGGNLQKMVISREIQNTEELLIALNPLSGLDIKYSARVFEEFVDMANQGVCIIFQSTNLNNLYGICDRIAVFNKGKLAGTLNKSDFNNKTVGNLMLS